MNKLNVATMKFIRPKVLLVIAVALIFVAGGWLIYSHNRKNVESAVEPALERQGDTAMPNDNRDISSSQMSSEKVSVPEMGITLTMPAGSELYAQILPDNSNAVSIRTHNLDDIEECKNDLLSSIVIFKELKGSKDALNGLTYGELYKDTGRFQGDYVYFLRGAQAACTMDSDKQKILTQARIDAVKAFNEMQLN